MSSNFLSQKVFLPTPPEKGSFPLDHDGTCKVPMLRYMVCLGDNRQDNSKCRSLAKQYLECRMDNNLMAKEDWKTLGLSDIDTDAKENK